MFERIKKFYDLGLWTNDMVRNAVVKGLITPEEYKDITSEEYIK